MNEVKHFLLVEYFQLGYLVAGKLMGGKAPNVRWKMKSLESMNDPVWSS